MQVVSPYIDIHDGRRAQGDKLSHFLKASLWVSKQQQPSLVACGSAWPFQLEATEIGVRVCSNQALSRLQKH